MSVNSVTSSWHIGSAAAKNGQPEAFSREKPSASRWNEPDTVDISQQARNLLSASSLNELAMQDAGSYLIGDSTAGKSAGVLGKGLKKYLSNGANPSITDMNMSRKNLGERINAAIANAGIRLGKDEKLTISVDAKNNVVVGGIKDKKKAKAIQEALNEDEKLGRELRKHTANAKIAEYAAKQEAYEKQMGEFGINVIDDLEENTDESFTSPGMRAFIIEEYLQDKAGISLSDLSIEKGADGAVSILGMNSELNSLLTEDAELGTTIANILENGHASSEFKVTFEFANGSISDSATTDMAKTKIDGVKARLMGGVDPATGEKYGGMINELIDNLKQVKDIDENFTAAIGRGFSIRVAANGEFEILGLDDVEWRLVESLKGYVQKALDQWAEDDPVSRSNSFADVTQAYVEQHHFEHGDTDQYEHMIEIDFSGLNAGAKVVSPEADKAQDAANQKVADQLGEKLMAMLDSEGIATDGLELEINESGKITVLGDPDNAEIRRAQALIDQFVDEAKAQGRDPAGEAGADEADRRAVKEGTKQSNEEDAPPVGVNPANVEAIGDPEVFKWKQFVADASAKILPFLPDPTLEDPESKRILDTYISWQKKMPKIAENAHFLSDVKSVSTIGKPKYAKDTEGDDAAGLYRELMNGMNQFHDDRRRVSYKLTA